MKNRPLFLAFLFAVSLSAQTDVLPTDTIPRVNVRLFPNPSHGITQVDITADGPATIWVTDRFGRVRLLREEDAVQAGTPLRLDLRGLEPGNYQVSVKLEGRRMYTRSLAME